MNKHYPLPQYRDEMLAELAVKVVEVDGWYVPYRKEFEHCRRALNVFGIIPKVSKQAEDWLIQQVKENNIPTINIVPGYNLQVLEIIENGKNKPTSFITNIVKYATAFLYRINKKRWHNVEEWNCFQTSSERRYWNKNSIVVVLGGDADVVEFGYSDTLNKAVKLLKYEFNLLIGKEPTSIFA